jgi:signal transduction histidine kinase
MHPTPLTHKVEDEKKTHLEELIEPTTALLAHEIKNPLGSMKLFLSLLEQDLTTVKDLLPPDTLTLLEHINTSVASVDSVITNALNFLVQERLRIGVVNIRSLIESELEMIRPRCQSIMLTSETRGNPFIQADERALGQALLNLLINAQEAVGTGGRIEVRCDAESDDSVKIVISDNGPGIPLHLHDSLFLPKVTTKQNGSGFGLALVKRIIENHHGEILCRSDHGTTMEIHLPRLNSGFNP